MKIKCKKCGDVLEGDKKGTYISCQCKACAIDETKWYWRIIGNREDFEVVEEKEEENDRKKSRNNTMVISTRYE